ncbi:hypothetical protein KY284_000223 [Solanum tuberosum]|nr:hypothetical protein KY284_000223 [Solanum tuberosum]
MQVRVRNCPPHHHPKSGLQRKTPKVPMLNSKERAINNLQCVNIITKKFQTSCFNAMHIKHKRKAEKKHLVPMTVVDALSSAKKQKKKASIAAKGYAFTSIFMQSCSSFLETTSREDFLRTISQVLTINQKLYKSRMSCSLYNSR